MGVLPHLQLSKPWMTRIEWTNLIMLPAVVLVENFSERIFPDHHMKVGRTQFLPQVKDDRESKVSVTTCQSLAQGARLLLELNAIELIDHLCYKRKY